jgi:hypothetical protein
MAEGCTIVAKKSKSKAACNKLAGHIFMKTNFFQGQDLDLDTEIL